MAAGFRPFTPLLIAITALLSAAFQAEAGNCTLNKNTGQLMMVERNVMTLEKQLAGTEKAGAVASLRAKVEGLKKRAAAFPGKAAPIEKECEGWVEEGKALDAMKKERDKQLAEINAKIKENKEEYDRVIGPKRQALRAELDSIHAMGCPFDGTELEKKHYERCAGPENSYNSHASALRSETDRYRAKHDQLVAQKQKVSKPYADRLQKAKSGYQGFRQKWEGYNNEMKSWNDDLKVAWGESTQLFVEVQKSRQRRVQQAPGKPQGGELGKLSGPMEKGSSGRDPGSAKLPGSVNAGGEGGAKGQARAAKSTGQQGAGAKNDSEAAFQAGRVFDRGDVKVSGDASVVDARGIQPRGAPSEKVRQNPRWQALDQKEQAYRVEQRKAEQKIEAIEKKLQAGEGDKGKLQVELVRARDAKDKVDSQINVIKVEKESFQLSIEEKSTEGAVGQKKGK